MSTNVRVDARVNVDRPTDKQTEEKLDMLKASKGMTKKFQGSI